MKDWWVGTRDGEFVSMAVASDGSYGIPEGLIFSFPVECTGNGEWKIVQGLNISDPYSKSMINTTKKELEEERQSALEILKSMMSKGNLEKGKI